MSYSKFIKEIVAEQQNLNRLRLDLSKHLQAAMKLSDDDIEAAHEYEIYFVFETDPPLQVYTMPVYVQDANDWRDGWHNILVVNPHGDYDEVYDAHREWFHERRRLGGRTETICIPDDETIERLLQKIKDGI